MLKGSIVALITPMKADGSIDYKGLEQLIDYHLQEQTDGLLVLGTTGESSTLTLEEEEEILRVTVKKVAGRLPVIAGAGSNDTKETIKKVQRFAELGADQLLVITPYYNKTSQKGLLAHFTAIADASSAPIILYNVPSRTGLSISFSVLNELAKHPKISGIKEASGDMAYTTEVAQLADESFALYSGNDELIVPVLSVGGVGAISVWANLEPRRVHELILDYFNKDTESARKKQLAGLPLIHALFSEINPIPVKAAMALAGLPSGPLRLPLVALEEMEQLALRKYFSNRKEANS